MKIRLCACLMVLALAVYAGQSLASVGIWKDPEMKYAFSFPASWQPQFVERGHLRYVVRAPKGSGVAECKVHARKDGRFVMHPFYDLPDVTREYINRDFFAQQFSEYHNVEIKKSGYGGIGDAMAIHAVMDFVTEFDGEPHHMRGIVFATLYHDLEYVIHCYSSVDEYERWQPLLRSIVASTEFDKRYHELPIGDYRNFLADAGLRLPVEQSLEQFGPGTDAR